jgi:hypothetical protein
MVKKTKPPETDSGRRNAIKRDRSWSLLMVGDHGQIIPFRRVKGIAMILITVATLAVLAAVGLGFWGGWLRWQNAGLRSELDASREAVRKLRDEKDLLMAKVVIMEARTQKAETADKSAKTEALQDESPGAMAEKPASPTASAIKAPTTTSATPEEKKAEVAQPTPSVSAATSKVAVSAFIADHSPRRNTLFASFKIENTDPRGQKVSGRCVLVMKNTVKSETQWVSVPHVSLLNGRPTGKQGRAFRIANFMNLKMQTQEVPASFAFETGTLYVFENDGKQILEKEVPVQLRYHKPAPKPKPKPKPKPEPEPIAKQPPEPEPADQPQTTSPPESAIETGKPSLPETGVGPPEMAPTTTAPTLEQTGVDAALPTPAVSDNGPAGNTAPPAPPATTVDGDDTTAPIMKPGEDPSLLPKGDAAPETTMPETGVEDPR